MRPLGLEPRTCGLRVRCSAIELEAPGDASRPRFRASTGSVLFRVLVSWIGLVVVTGTVGCSAGGGSESLSATNAYDVLASNCEELARPDHLPRTLLVGPEVTEQQLVAAQTAEPNRVVQEVVQIFLQTVSEAAPEQWGEHRSAQWWSCARRSLAERGISSVADALQAGYVHWGDLGSSHLISGPCVSDGMALLATCPEALVVDDSRVAGVMFIASAPLASVVNPAGELGTWHVHEQNPGFCTGGNFTRLEDPVNGRCAVGTLITRSVPMMHVKTSATDAADAWESVHTASMGKDADVRSE